MAKESPATVSVLGPIPTSALVDSEIYVSDQSSRTWGRPTVEVVSA